MEALQEWYATYQSTIAYIGINALLALSVYTTLSCGQLALASAFFISSALGGAAGVLFGLAYNSVSPDLGRSVELKGLAVIIVGGMGSMTGAVVAGFALGLVEVFVVSSFGASYRDAVSFAALFLILVLRPRGLFGAPSLREA